MIPGSLISHNPNPGLAAIYDPSRLGSVGSPQGNTFSEFMARAQSAAEPYSPSADGYQAEVSQNEAVDSRRPEAIESAKGETQAEAQTKVEAETKPDSEAQQPKKVESGSAEAKSRTTELEPGDKKNAPKKSKGQADDLVVLREAAPSLKEQLAAIFQEPSGQEKVRAEAKDQPQLGDQLILASQQQPKKGLKELPNQIQGSQLVKAPDSQKAKGKKIIADSEVPLKSETKELGSKGFKPEAKTAPVEAKSPTPELGQSQKTGPAREMTQGSNEQEVKVEVLRQTSTEGAARTKADLGNHGDGGGGNARDPGSRGNQQASQTSTNPGSGSAHSLDHNAGISPMGTQGSVDSNFQTALADKTPASQQLREFLKTEAEPKFVSQARITVQNGEAAEIKLILKPENMGEVRMKLEMAENRLVGTISVDSKEVQKVFEERMADLNEALKDAGIDSSTINVEVHSGGDGNETSADNAEAQAMGRIGRKADGGAEQQSKPQVVVYETSLDTRVNVFA